MPPKRKRQNSTPAALTTKRTKFTLDYIKLPDTSIKGEVLVTGSGDVGQLGLGPDVLEKSRATLVDLGHDIVDIYAGGMHTVCLTKDGKVLTFGCNDEGALGRLTDGKEDAEFTPGEVELPGKVIQVTAGDSHTAALLDDGRVFAWGTFRDSHGNMGLTVNGNERLPCEIIQDQKILKIASGADHIVLLNSHGEVYTCGCAEQGQLGRITRRGSDRDARTNSHAKNIGKLLTPALISLKPRLRLHFDNIWTGTYCTFIRVAEKNDIYVFGLNNFNQIGLDVTEPEYIPTKSKDFSKYSWKHITGGQHHTLGLTTQGKVFAIGRKEYGRLGLGKGSEDATVLTEVTTLSNDKIINVACGSATSFAVSDQGVLFGWGMGTNGQLGLGGDEDCDVPMQVKSKQMIDRKIIRVSSGGQHTVILSSPNTKR